MHEHGLARELFPQLQSIAKNEGFGRITRIDMISSISAPSIPARSSARPTPISQPSPTAGSC